MRLRKRARPAPPPQLSADEGARLGAPPASDAFLTGNGFAARCRYAVNYEGLVENEDADNDWWFCRVDLLDWFFEEAMPRRPFVLVSHNSDYPIDERYRPRLGKRRLEAWLAANVALRHPKLVPIPLGIANPSWPHGDTATLLAAQGESRQKRELFDVSFGVETNVRERGYCLEQTGLEPAPRVGHAEYLSRLGAAYFCIAPSGYGIDTHRTWEALYLSTVPVVTRSALTDEYADLPLVVLDDWSEFRDVDFSPELHRRLTADWDPAALSMDAFLARMRRRVASLT
jgi:hypothetical protein